MFSRALLHSVVDAVDAVRLRGTQEARRINNDYAQDIAQSLASLKFLTNDWAYLVKMKSHERECNLSCMA